jgi:hypothetical protein
MAKTYSDLFAEIRQSVKILPLDRAQEPGSSSARTSLSRW